MCQTGFQRFQTGFGWFPIIFSGVSASSTVNLGWSLEEYVMRGHQFWTCWFVHILNLRVLRILTSKLQKVLGLSCQPIKVVISKTSHFQISGESHGSDFSRMSHGSLPSPQMSCRSLTLVWEPSASAARSARLWQFRAWINMCPWHPLYPLFLSVCLSVVYLLFICFLSVCICVLSVFICCYLFNMVLSVFSVVYLFVYLFLGLPLMTSDHRNVPLDPRVVGCLWGAFFDACQHKLSSLPFFLGRHRPGCPPKIATPMGGASTSASRFSQARNHLSLRSWWLKFMSTLVFNMI